MASHRVVKDICFININKLCVYVGLVSRIRKKQQIIKEK